MNIGVMGWILVERLLWASLSLAFGFGAATLVSRLSFIAPTAKAWAWRVVLLQAALVLTFNFAVGIQVLQTPVSGGGAQAAINPIWSAIGAGAGAFWLVPACLLLFGLARSAWTTRRMLMELPTMPLPVAASERAASYRLMRELSCPVVALCPRPLVAAPEWCWHNTPQARLALAHEAAHLRRWDVAWQMLGSAASALFWFHPLAQLAMKELSFWQECAADAAAIKMIDCEHHDYATAIVDIVAGLREPQIPLALGLGMQARQLGRRLEVAVDGPLARPWLGAMVALVFISPALVPWRASAVIVPVREGAHLAAPIGEVGRVTGGPTPPYSPIASAAGG